MTCGVSRWRVMGTCWRRWRRDEEILFLVVVSGVLGNYSLDCVYLLHLESKMTTVVNKRIDPFDRVDVLAKIAEEP